MPSTDPYVVKVTSSGTTLTFEPSRVYTLVHLGKDAAGADATEEVFGDVAGDRAASYANDTDKMILQNGKSYAIGPSLNAYNLITASGDVMVQVIPTEPHRRPW